MKTHRLLFVVPVSVVMGCVAALGGNTLPVRAGGGHHGSQFCDAHEQAVQRAQHRHHRGELGQELERRLIVSVDDEPMRLVGAAHVGSLRMAPASPAIAAATAPPSRRHVSSSPAPAGAPARQPVAQPPPRSTPPPDTVVPVFPALLPSPLPAITAFSPSMLGAQVALGLTAFVAAAAALAAGVASRRAR